jgi:predicted Fe-Mo cluster-binding NifX family protein
MAIRLALSSSNGISVDEHFSQASSFYIYEIKDGTPVFLEKRISRGSSGHSQEAIDTRAAIISDCKAVFVCRIGSFAAERLHAKGIRVFEAPYPVDIVIREIRKGNPEFSDEVKGESSNE